MNPCKERFSQSHRCSEMGGGEHLIPRGILTKLGGDLAEVNRSPPPSLRSCLTRDTKRFL